MITGRKLLPNHHLTISKWLPNDHRIITEWVSEWLPNEHRMITEWSTNDHQIITESSINDSRMITERPQNDHRTTTKRSPNDYRMAYTPPPFVQRRPRHSPIQDKTQSAVMMTFVLALSVGIAISILLFWHIYLIYTAQTTIEFYQNQANRTRARQRGEVRGCCYRQEVCYWKV